MTSVSLNNISLSLMIHAVKGQRKMYNSQWKMGKDIFTRKRKDTMRQKKEEEKSHRR